MSDISKLPKWAQAEFERLRRERDLLTAFHRTRPVEPDVDVPKHSEKDKRGFTYNSHTRNVYHSISSSTGHSTSHLDCGPCPRTTSQRPIKQYSSKLLAARALRWAVEQDCAVRLAEVDRLIQEFENE